MWLCVRIMPVFLCSPPQRDPKASSLPESHHSQCLQSINKQNTNGCSDTCAKRERCKGWFIWWWTLKLVLIYLPGIICFESTSELIIPSSPQVMTGFRTRGLHELNVNLSCPSPQSISTTEKSGPNRMTHLALHPSKYHSITWTICKWFLNLEILRWQWSVWGRITETAVMRVSRHGKNNCQLTSLTQWMS